MMPSYSIYFHYKDFGKFMKENRLAPSTFAESSSDETPIEKGMSHVFSGLQNNKNLAVIP